MKPTDKIFCNTFGTHFQMYYKMRILPVIFLFSMMTKAQDNFILGFLIHGVNLILNKGMTGIWIARRYWLSIRSQYIHQYIMYFGGGKTYFSQSSFSMYSLSIWVIFFSFLALFYQCHLLFSAILEFLFDDKFDTGYFSSRLNWLKFNIYIGQFIDFCLCFF